MSKLKMIITSIFGLLTVLVVTFCLTGVDGTKVKAQSNLPPETSVPTTKFKPGPTTVVEIDDPEWGESVTQATLVRESKFILVGDVVRNACNPSASIHQVTTDYQVRVAEVIKGKFDIGSIVTVSMPGGLIMKRDGSILNVRTQKIRKMWNGRKYLLFLKNATGNDHAMMPLRGSQGVFEISQNGSTIISSSPFEFLPDDNASRFLENIRGLVKNAKDN